MKTLKFPGKSVPTNSCNSNLSINSTESAYEISALKGIYDSRSNRNQISNSRKFRIALFAAYSSLLAIFVLIVYTAIVLDPKFPF